MSNNKHLATIRVLQEENHNLKAVLGQLRDDIKQKDTLIATLESQLRSLILVNRNTPDVITEDAEEEDGSGQGGKGTVVSSSSHDDGDDDSNDEQTTTSRVSSIGFASAVSPVRTQDHRSSKDKRVTDKPSTSKEQGRLETISSSTSNGGTFNDNDNENTEHTRRSVNAIQTGKGAIKALPRELSIYNSADDDVTKYSVDDGKPTYVVDGPIPFRDAYNVRGLYNGSVNRANQLPHGQGRMKYNIGGTCYEGEWALGHWHGTGKVIDKSGNVYEGQFVNDLKHGQGREEYVDGRVFDGIFVEGDVSEGTMVYPNGSKYVGPLRNGQRNGKGAYYFEDGSVYEGESKDNLFEGQGKMVWPDGGWYEGEWKNGTMDGYGKEIRPDGSLRHEGKWIDGAPIRE